LEIRNWRETRYIYIYLMSEQCVELQNIEYQTMLLNNNIDTLKLAEKLTKFATDIEYVKKVKATILNLRNERVQNTD